MKGASDGGLHIPHSDKRFPGHHIQKAEIVTSKRGKAIETEKAKATFDPKEHRQHIFGQHVQTYYDALKSGDSQQKFQKQFSQWEKALKGKKFEDLYKSVHAAIRANPARKAKKASKPVRKVAKTETGYKIMANGQKKQWIVHQKLTHEQRKERVANRMGLIMASLQE